MVDIVLHSAENCNENCTRRTEKKEYIKHAYNQGVNHQNKVLIIIEVKEGLRNRPILASSLECVRNAYILQLLSAEPE